LIDASLSPPQAANPGGECVDANLRRKCMRPLMPPNRVGAEPRQFYSVAEAARLFGMSEMTLYRAIHDGQFPAVRIRGRLIVPARAIEAITAAAMEDNRLVDAADWVPGSTS
jgi:excisionase family DNA binding protein